MNFYLGYPEFLWIASIAATDRPRKNKSLFRLLCLIQGMFNVGILYVLYKTAIVISNINNFLMINGADMSIIGSIIVFGFALYLTPLFGYGGIVLFGTAFFYREAKHIKLYYTIPKAGMKELINDYFYITKNKSKLLDMLSAEDRNTAIINKITFVEYNSDKKGNFIKLFYRERIGYEWDEIKDTKEYKEFGELYENKTDS